MGDKTSTILDLSKQSLKKINKATDEESKTVVDLIINENELQRLDNIDSFKRVENLSISGNYLIRMYGVAKLLNLRTLALDGNGILQIEGLKELIYLKSLSLSGNSIKSIEHLNYNMHLEYLNLSNNHIAFISDISYLKNLKHLKLEKNKVSHLKQCERYLPNSLQTLGLADNNICDLNQMSHLVHLNQLENFTIRGNPCVSMTGKDTLGFDYRPFIINWIMGVKTIDGFVVSAMESLKAEWLYSQGRGRHFGEDEHEQLCTYLASTCPLTAEALETEEQRKLRLILSKAQHHQQQLREQAGNTTQKSKMHSPRLHGRIASRCIGKSPDRAMSSSCHSALPARPSYSHTSATNQMSLSYSGEMSAQTTKPLSVTRTQQLIDNCYASAMSQSYETPGQMFGTREVVKTSSASNLTMPSECRTGPERTEKRSDIEWKPTNVPLEAASKMVPVPESLMSPDYQEPPLPLDITTSTATHKRASNGSLTDMDSRIAKSRSMNKGSIMTANPRGSPKFSRSAMSSPKLKPRMDQRKGSFSSRSLQGNGDHMRGAGDSGAQIGTGDSVAHNQLMHGSGDIAYNKILGNITPPETRGANSSDEDSEVVNVEKLRSIKAAANQRRQKKTASESSSVQSDAVKNPLTAAVTIQRMWRGYRSRNLDARAGRVLAAIQAARAADHINRLHEDMRATKAALHSERKIQQLQMQAINALWRKVSSLQPGGDDNIHHSHSSSNGLILDNDTVLENEAIPDIGTVRQLTETCQVLQTQVGQLQEAIQDIKRYMAGNGLHSDNGKKCQCDSMATQTDISAVMTPQGEISASWPYQRIASRPSSLPLSMQQLNSVQAVSQVTSQFIPCDDTEATTRDVTSNIMPADETTNQNIIITPTNHEIAQKIARETSDDFNDDTSEGITMEERINDDNSKCSDTEMSKCDDRDISKCDEKEPSKCDREMSEYNIKETSNCEDKETSNYDHATSKYHNEETLNCQNKKCEDKEMSKREDRETSKCDDKEASNCESKKTSKCEDKEASKCEDKEESKCGDKKESKCESKKTSKCEDKEASKCEDKEESKCGDKKESNCESKKTSKCEDKEASKCEDKEESKCGDKKESKCESKKTSKCEDKEASKCEDKEEPKCEDKEESKCEDSVVSSEVSDLDSITPVV